MTISKVIDAIGIVCAIIAAAGFGLVVGAALAHEAPSGWSYDGWCCSDEDCHPLPAGAVIPTDAGWLIVSSGRVVPYDASQVRQSGDSQFHICEPAQGMIRCLYVPDMGF